jgi:hypothetical protein
MLCYSGRVPWPSHLLTVGIIVHFPKLIEERVIDFVDGARLDAKFGSLKHRYQLLSVHQFYRRRTFPVCLLRCRCGERSGGIIMIPLSARPIMAFLKSPTAARDTEPLYFLH